MAKKWVVRFAVILVIILALIAGLNVLCDPFGVFGDPLMKWYSFDFTNNPRAAKIAYLEKDDNHAEYDSYIVGASATSGISSLELNSYLDASFFNMIMYGADMLDVESTCYYLMENYEVKNLVVNFSLANSTKYDFETDELTGNMDWRVEGKNSLGFYAKYAFINPQYSLQKLWDKSKDTYLNQSFDVFDVKTGEYDKRARDVEGIDSLENYLAANSIFENYPDEHREALYIDETLEGLLRIKERCEREGVRLILISSPMYADYFSWYDYEDIESFYLAMAEELEFWDFAMNSVSRDPRYFYDEGHFRNTAGTMALAKIFENDESYTRDEYYQNIEGAVTAHEQIYMPEDFGFYVTKESVGEYLTRFKNMESLAELDTSSYSKAVPILLYHHIVEDNAEGEAVSRETFTQHMDYLVAEGYTAVSFEEMIAYVDGEIELPEKPICITFDDGYLSNYEIAYPILRERGLKATIFAIGVSVGKDTYKDTENAITPHFDYKQAREMVDSGVISVQSHTFDMHQWADFETADFVRNNMKMKDGEDEETYISAVRDDLRMSINELENGTGKPANVLAYPGGEYNALAEVIAAQEGFLATVSTREGDAVLTKGLPQSLRGMRRHYVYESTSLAEFLEK